MTTPMPNQAPGRAARLPRGGSALLSARLDAVRTRLAVVACGTAASLALSWVLVALAGVMLADWWLELPLWARTVALLANLAGCAALVFLLAVRPLLRQPDDDALALMVEKRRPSFRTRFIAAVQLGRPGALSQGASRELVAALVAETEKLAAPLNAGEIVPASRLKRQARNAALLLALAVAAFLHTREISGALLQRALLIETEVPRKTRVDVVGGDKLIGRGDSVTIIARARGYAPKTGTLLMTHASGHAEEINLLPEAGDARKFSQVIENVQDSFTYKVRLFDGASPRFRVEAVPRPEIAFLEANQIYPAYTGLGTVRRSLGDLVLLAGSKLQLRASATKDISRATVSLAGLNKEVPMQINATNRRELTATIPVPVKELSGISLHLADLHGVRSKDPAVYRVDILPDKPPVVRITYPERKEDLVTAMATMLIGFEASDDYALGKVFLRYKISTAEQGAEKSLELDLGGETPKSLRHRFEWPLRHLSPPPTEGSLIEFWLEVVDTNNETGPGTGISEHYVVRVVSEAEKRADLMNRVNDYLGGITEVARDQEKLNEILGGLIRLKPQ